MKNNDDDDQGARGRSLTGESATGSPRSPQPDSSPHTPGPWMFEAVGDDVKFDREAEIPDGCAFWIVDTRVAGEVLALMLDPMLGTQEANARLMAAAPELLAALYITSNCAPVTDDLAKLADDAEITLGFTGADIRQIRAAIAKAEGR